MQARCLRECRAAEAAAADLAALRGDGVRTRKPPEVGGRTSSTGSAPPAEQTTLSLLDEAMRTWEVEKAAIHESVTPVGPTEEPACRHGTTIAAALAAHIDQIPEEQLTGLVEANRAILARFAQALAREHGIPTLPCPNRHLHNEPRLARSIRKHIEQKISKTGAMVSAATQDTNKVAFVDSGIRGNTVAPEHVLREGTPGMLSCFHPSCYTPDGQRKRFQLADLLPHGGFTALTLHEMARIWGFTYDSLYKACIGRAKTPLTPSGERRDAQGKVSTTYCVGDVQNNPTIAKRLTVPDQ